jgi:hypothetical protein
MANLMGLPRPRPPAQDGIGAQIHDVPIWPNPGGIAIHDLVDVAAIVQPEPHDPAVVM